MIALICLGIAVLSGYGIVWGFKQTIKAGKYEFENRTSGGTIEFNDYSSSIKHKAKKEGAAAVVIVSIFVGGIALAILFFIMFSH